MMNATYRILNRGIFVTEHAGTPFQEFFLRRMKAGMAFWNLLP
jgi:hypothetical protein